MSDLDPQADSPVLTGGAAAEPVTELLTSRSFAVGDGTMVRRLLPQRRLRTVGAWCFADHYGPDDVSASAGMQVPPHPHTGLQTVSWLLEGEIVHRDSLGSLERVGPHEVSLMTSGWGISHSEESPAERPPVLHGVQLWVALPANARHASPSYEHHTILPKFQYGALRATLFLGEHADELSPGTTWTRLVGLDLRVDGDGLLPLEPTFEHAIFVMSGTAVVEGTELAVGELLHLGCGRDELQVSGEGARLMLLGGEPLGEQLVLWWNFVCRSGEEVAEAREQWEREDDRFGKVEGYPGSRLSAPVLGPAKLLPRS